MIEQQIVDYMKEHDYRWKINDELIVPTVEDVTALLDKFRDTLFAEDSTPDATIIMTTGRLVIKRDGDHMDVYIHLGDANERNNRSS